MNIFLGIAFLGALFWQCRCFTRPENPGHGLEEWVVRAEGGPEVAELIALRMGYRFLGEVTGFKDTYRMVPKVSRTKRKRGRSYLTKRLVDDSRVIWAEQQFAKERQKRGFLEEEETYDSPMQRPFLWNDSVFRGLPFRRRRFNDELWDQQWYLQDTRTRADLPKLDLHVLPCYDLGVTGKGIRVSILDDGIEFTHSDLRDNYDPEISYDANNEDSDPTPRYDPDVSNAHGTRCAGEVAMKANNGICGVGVAHDARIGAVRLLDGQVDDRVEGIALGYAHEKVDIYSASWGPNDDGKTVEGPGRLATEAIERGIREGRNGLGVIYVWAAGNGGSKGDNCDCDGYTGSIYTLSIGSASQQGRFPWYGEKCASTMAATYSSGAYSDQMIATTDLRNTCTVKHTGTSASAPLAAGIIALALEINRNLTWRDVQHLVAWTSEYEPLKENEGWLTNAAGFRVNTRFGFGLMNAFRLVTAAANWRNVPEKSVCSAKADRSDLELSFESDVRLFFDGRSCVDINYLEHVELQINVMYPVRGDLEITLTSPAGTEVQLLSSRRNDASERGFKDWKLMSVLTWGENPRGIWRVVIKDGVGSSGSSGRVGSFVIHFHGTKERPAYLSGRSITEPAIAEEDPDERNEVDRWFENFDWFLDWTRSSRKRPFPDASPSSDGSSPPEKVSRRF